MTFTTEPMTKEYHAEPVDVGYQRGLIIKSTTTGAEVPNAPVFTADRSHQARITVDMMNLAYAAGAALLVPAAKMALRAVEKDLLPLQAKMSTMSGPALAIYEDSPVYKGLIQQRDSIKAALLAAAGSAP